MSQTVLSTASVGWNLDYSYLELPPAFYSLVEPESVPHPKLVFLNGVLAQELGLDFASVEEASLAAWFAAKMLPPGARPFAQAYAGHQYAHLTMLGDGRALVVGEQVAPNGKRWDVQWKGSGRTPYSRRGDGKAALGPMLREVIISEALHYLGVPTTRSLAVATTGESVYRDRPLPGAVLTRVAASHLRIGTFEFAAARQKPGELEALTRYALRRHYCEDGETYLGSDPGRVLLRGVAWRQMELVARWMSIGFVHGVMNTDNVAISGEAIDFGPCAFLDTYRADAVFSSIDRHGRYRYSQQPAIALWNLARLAEALLPLIAAEEDEALAWAEDFLRECHQEFPAVWARAFRPKLGLFNEEAEDVELIEDLLGWMEKTEADFTNTFRELSPEPPVLSSSPRDMEWTIWHQRWVARLQRQPQSAAEATQMRAKSNPVLHPRNHRVEEALAAAENGDYALFHRLVEMVREPYRENPDWEIYRQSPPPGGAPYRTFCGT